MQSPHNEGSCYFGEWCEAGWCTVLVPGCNTVTTDKTTPSWCVFRALQLECVTMLQRCCCFFKVGVLDAKLLPSSASWSWDRAFDLDFLQHLKVVTLPLSCGCHSMTEDLYVTGVQDGAAAVCLAQHISTSVQELLKTEGRSLSTAPSVWKVYDWIC